MTYEIMRMRVAAVQLVPWAPCNLVSCALDLHPINSILLIFFHIPHPGTDDEVQEYDYLGAWGPRFDKLANMYGPEHQTELDDLN